MALGDRRPQRKVSAPKEEQRREDAPGSNSCTRDQAQGAVPHGGKQQISIWAASLYQALGNCERFKINYRQHGKPETIYLILLRETEAQGDADTESESHRQITILQGLSAVTALSPPPPRLPFQASMDPETGCWIRPFLGIHSSRQIFWSGK